MIKLVFVNFLLRKLLFTATAAAIFLMAAVGLDFSTYRQLTSQESIFKVSVVETDKGIFSVHLQSDSFDKQFLLQGDQWQIDFRLIRFSPLVSLTGLSYLYQPSRLSSRYEDIDNQRTMPLQFYSLREGQAPAIDLWEYLRNYEQILPMIDTTFGSSVFMPLKHNAEYEILIGFSGLVVKAANDQSRLAVQHWQ
jgi:hypothetical protein